MIRSQYFLQKRRGGLSEPAIYTATVRRKNFLLTIKEESGGDEEERDTEVLLKKGRRHLYRDQTSNGEGNKRVRVHGLFLGK